MTELRIGSASDFELGQIKYLHTYMHESLIADEFAAAQDSSAWQVEILPEEDEACFEMWDCMRELYEYHFSKFQNSKRALGL